MNNEDTVVPTTTFLEKTCPCCNGSGVQQKNDGIKIICPACNGSGKIMDSYPRQPIYPIYPWYPPYYPTVTWQCTCQNKETK